MEEVEDKIDLKSKESSEKTFFENLKKEKNDSLSDNNPDIFNSEDNFDGRNFLKSILKNRQFISGETWDKTINIHSRIVEIHKEVITCECLLDKENNIFENRIFAKELFDDSSYLRIGSLIFISIKSKTGSIRIDITDGSKIIDPTPFKLKDKWDNFDGLDLGAPLDKPLVL